MAVLAAASAEGTWCFGHECRWHGRRGLGGAGGLGGGPGAVPAGASAVRGRSAGNMNNGMNAMGQQGQGFLGVNTNPNNFLGRNVQGQGQNGMMNQNMGGNRRGGGNRGNPNGGMFNNQQQQGGMGVGFGGAQRQAPPIRPRQKVAFEHTPAHLPTVSTKLETKLNKMTSLKSSNVKLSVSPEGEVVLRGHVASAERAKVAEIIARQEPGVRKVRNELTYPDTTQTP
ncbi:BON domain-containing protein [Schlesneria sp. DSM 10557]|uniref:BON domain-containing protein n=1 Tax=Schlesneria sp. DSM 10557 TaxID=3044399 RepID=UPI0035A1562C